MSDETPPRTSWESLSRKTSEQAGPPPSDTIEEMVMRAVLIGPGAELLAWLRKEYIEKRDPPNCHEAQLRESEACRRLVDRLEKMRDRGVALKTERNKT